VKENTPQEIGRLYGLAFVGLEMVAPIVIGVFVDRHWNCSPWGVGVGVVVGLVGGIAHLAMIARHQERMNSPSPKAPTEPQNPTPFPSQDEPGTQSPRNPS
jgi:hypothetical protein